MYYNPLLVQYIRMLEKLIQKLISVPISRRWFWKKWYNFLAGRKADIDFQLMNYGYFAENLHPELENNDEPERYSIHLYHYVATQINLSGKNVLEVGSGRGGGASYIARYLHPKTMTGIDISKYAVEFCKKIHSVPNLNFQVGDSEDILFLDGNFDVVINVESSHCYGSMEIFLKEVRRVLKPGGYFLYCDFRPTKQLNILNKQLLDSGLKLMQKTDITDNIITALDLVSANRKDLIHINVPQSLRKLIETFAGIRGTRIYNAFYDGSAAYICAALKKPA